MLPESKLIINGRLKKTEQVTLEEINMSIEEIKAMSPQDLARKLLVPKEYAKRLRKYFIKRSTG